MIFAFTHGQLTIFLLLIDSEGRNNRRMAKSENHHGNRDPDLVPCLCVQLHLTGEVFRLPAANQVDGEEQETANQREDEESHHFDGHMTPHQEDQIQYQHHGEAQQSAYAVSHRHVSRQLFSQRISDCHGVDQDHYEEGEKVQAGDQIADFLP